MTDRIRDIQRRVRAAAELPLERGMSSPPEAYTDPDYFEWEVEHLLRADWLALCHLSQIHHAGDYYNLELLGDPITVVRGKDGAVRVLSRACPHRAADVMPPEEPRRGNRRLFICPYHRWTFELDGQVKGCPEMHRAEGFNKRDWKLAEYRSEVWNGFVFVNLSGDAAPVAAQYADLAPVAERWGVAEMRVAIELEWDTKANWKAIMENWIESYHHLGAHAGTLNPMMPAQDTWAEPEHPHLIRCHLPYRDELVDQIEGAEASGAHHPGFLPVRGLGRDDRSEWGLYIGYPHFQFLVMRDRVIWYRALPVAPDRTEWLTTTLVAEESALHPDFPAWVEAETKMLRDFHLEDMLVVEAVQRGMRSSRARPGRFSHLDEPVWLFQRWLAARYEGAYPGSGDTLPRHAGAGMPARRRGARR
jgi:phenylpropionate dioxygenase-like ring-hydroxylating dioxygenase large terminal subunit